MQSKGNKTESSLAIEFFAVDKHDDSLYIGTLSVKSKNDLPKTIIVIQKGIVIGQCIAEYTRTKAKP